MRDPGATSVVPVTNWRRAGIVLAVIVSALLLAFVVWASLARPADPEALGAALADPRVEVTLGSVIELRPAAGEPARAVVFYPGARVSHDAYVATWVPIVAETDTLVLIPRMPLNLAIFGRGRAGPLIDDRPEVDGWWVGGHSLGGAMAASWLGGRAPGEVDGLVLWASFSTGGAGLEDRDDLEVLSASGTRDGLATPADIDERRDLLPDDTTFVAIEGMNHAQFGRYGEQARDLPPRISDAEAQRRLTEAHVHVWASTADR